MNQNNEIRGYYCTMCPVVTVTTQKEGRPQCSDCGRPMKARLEKSYGDDQKAVHGNNRA